MQHSIVEDVKRNGASALVGLKDRFARYGILDERLFPSLLQQKIKHFIQNVVGLGLENDASWIRWLEPIVVRAIDSTDALRWELCGTSAQVLHELMMSEDYPGQADSIPAVHKHLVQSRNELRKRINVSGLAPKAATGSDEMPHIAGAITAFEPPFYNRESVLDTVRRFVESSDRNCLVLAGMRGIGKTSAAKEVFKKVIPPTWKSVWISLTEGAAYQRLLSDVAYRCRIRVPSEVDSEASQVELVQDILLYFSNTPRVVLVLDDLQFLLDPSGDFLDNRTGTFLSDLLRRSASSRNRLLLITTNVPKFQTSLNPKIDVAYLPGLDRKHAEDLLSFWFHFEREDLQGQPVVFPDHLFRVLSGHPLGLRIAAKMWAENPFAEGDLAMFKRLRETVVEYVLDRVKFAPREQDFLRFASVFRLPVGREIFLKWGKDEATFLIDSLIGRSFLETDADKYQLHPLIREHFYNATPASDLLPFHRLAGAYFLDAYSRAKSSGADPDPEMLGEAIHHYLASGDRSKVQSFGLYKSELKPVARNHYHKAEYDLALKDYALLVQLDPGDLDAHFHLALIYARRSRWDEAETHFGKALALNPKAYWVYQGFAHLKLLSGRVPEAEDLLKKAERIKEYHSPTLVDLGSIRERQNNHVKAEELYRRAIDADENNAFAYSAYAKFLLQQDRYEEGLAMALAAVEINPRNSRNRELVRDLRQRIDAAKKWVNESKQLTLTKGKEWDVFISHASEDKSEIVRPLAEALRKEGIRVWYDEFSLKLGDSLRRSIDHGLASSQYGVVVLSKNFLAKHWPGEELHGLATNEIGGRKVILPVWHKVSFQEVRSFSPILADKLAVRSDEGIDKVVERILDVIRPSK